LPINKLPQAQFIDSLRRLNGTPAEILDDTELMRLIMPTLRADFALNEDYSYQSGTRLNCNILAFGGIRDPEAGRGGINDWRDVTDGQFLLRMVPGDHFFIRSAQSLFLRTLSMELHAVIRPLLSPHRRLDTRVHSG
jgi:medium-chain acyl-[acyl-carrier-protein] hydrolase